MYKEILRSIENVAMWPEISLVIFFVFFLLLLWWVFTSDKKFIKYMENIPLREDSITDHQSQNENHHEK